MTKRPGLRAAMPAADREEVTQATAAVTAIASRRAAAATPAPAVDEVMTSTSVHMPVELLDALRAAANRRSVRQLRERGPRLPGAPKRESTRPSVSEIVVEMLTRHRDELDRLD